MIIFEVRQIDGIIYDNEWIWNNSYFIGTFKTRAETARGNKTAFINFLKKHGITFKKNNILIYDEIDDMEIIDRKTKEPLFAAIWHEQ